MRHRSSGMLDVDIIDPGSNIAVENIIYTDTRSMPEGVYKFYVNNYNDRGGIGFDAEIEFDGTVFPISYTKKMRTGENVVVAEVEYTKKGVSEKEMLAVGLIKKAHDKPNTYYDTFRGRIMFPIGDTASRIVAFSGRALMSDEKTPKYLNSPDHTFFCL
jgi:hypothetical protein